MNGLKRAAKHAVATVARTAAGERLLQLLLKANAQAGTEAIFEDLNRQAGFDSVVQWPQQLDGFEDLAFLFSSSHLNVGVAVLAFDEAAYLYKLVKNLRDATIIEIGRYKGGSTFLLATAMDKSSQLYSYDFYADVTGPIRKSTGVLRYPASGSADLDRALLEALKRFGTDRQVHLKVADSKAAPSPSEECALVFVDGDHSYEGVTADFLNWAPRIPVGGDLLLHDAFARSFAPSAIGVSRLVEKIAADYGDFFEGPIAVGSLAHFTVKRRFVPSQAAALPGTISPTSTRSPSQT